MQAAEQAGEEASPTIKTSTPGSSEPIPLFHCEHVHRVSVSVWWRKRKTEQDKVEGCNVISAAKQLYVSKEPLLRWSLQRQHLQAGWMAAMAHQPGMPLTLQMHCFHEGRTVAAVLQPLEQRRPAIASPVQGVDGGGSTSAIEVPFSTHCACTQRLVDVCVMASSQM